MFKEKRSTLPSLIAFVFVPADKANTVAAALNETAFKGNVIRVSVQKWENQSGTDKRTIFVGNLAFGKMSRSSC